MSEWPKFSGEKETLEQRKERLRPMFQQSREVFQNADRLLREGALTVMREFQGATETICGLVVLDILDDAVELGGIEEDGEIGASAFMTWDEILDAKPETN